MKILMIAAEAAPLAKVGGLGDVVGALPKYLRRLGHDVRVALPHHGMIDSRRFPAVSVTHFTLPSRSGDEWVAAHEVRHDDVPIYLISGPPIPPRPYVYGGTTEDGHKFVFASLAALRLCLAIAWRPDVVHAHDWHAGAALGYLGTAGKTDPFFAAIASLFTIHNMPYSGVGAGDALWHYFLGPSPWMPLPEYLRWTPMAVALSYADLINAVSPGYAREILTPLGGHGFDSLLRLRSDRLAGVLNGIDVESWNPQTDPALWSNFDIDSIERRAANKRELQAAMGLRVTDEVPLLGVVSRLEFQKGFDIAEPAIRQWLWKGGQLILLGTGDYNVMSAYELMGRGFPGQASINLRFDAALASRIYGGADLMLIPSRYEPCGLTQMIAMRYGCVPVARRTGGLADRVEDYHPEGRGTGFLFDEPAWEAVWWALGRAWDVFTQPNAWRALQRRGMDRDFSWERSAQEYVELYERAVAYRKAG